MKHDVPKSKEKINNDSDFNNTSITINGEPLKIKTIDGYSKEVIKLTGYLNKLKKTSEEAEYSWQNIPINKGVKYDSKEILDFIENRGNSETEKNETESIKPDLSVLDILQQKIEQIKPAIQQFKQSLRGVSTDSKELELVKYKISEIEEKLEKAKNGKIHLDTKEIVEAEAKLEKLNNRKDKLEKNDKGSFFSSFFSGLKKITPSMDNISGKTIKIKNQIKQWGGGIKSGLGQVLKYAGALFSLRSIYSTLSNSAQSWLSSQNSEAKQLSANIEYMKYAMGSALAPVIQSITNLVYQLMRAVQSVAYALTGVNIFAKASASSYASMASSAKNAKNETKQLAGIHSEINNIQSNNGSNGSGGDSTAPSFDLSGINDTPNTIIEAIKSGNWYKVGATIGEKINKAMNSIPWDKIQNTAKNLGTDIAKLLNGFIGKTDWKQVGNTVAQGINTAVYFAQSFVHTFNWSGVGNAVANTINGFFSNTDWGALGDTISTGIKGALDGVTAFFRNFDWSAILDGLMDFVKNFDWNGVADAIFKALGSACASCVKLGTVIGKYIKEGFKNISQYFQNEIEECGGNVVLGILKGIGDAVIGIGRWIYDHVFEPFIEGFKDVFGIHSPSTVMAEMGRYLVEGLKNGISDLWNRVKAPFEEFSNNVSNKFNEIKNKINDWANNTKTIVSNWGSNIRSKISECWTNASNTVKDKVNSLKTNISTGLNNTKSTVSNWGDNIKNTFTNLGRNASFWGRDLAENMASGIRNNIYRITNAVNSVANKIKSFLHFTEPDEGPLSNFHTYMPDMLELMANGIRSNTGKIKSEMENLASMMSYTINTDSITSHNQIQPKINPINIQPSNVANRFEDVLSDLSSFNNSDRPIKIIVNVGNQKLGQILLDDLRDKTRRTGKDIEALVGG